MNIRDLAKSFTAFNGQVVFYLLPYSTMQVGVYIDALATMRGLTADSSGQYTISGGDAIFVYCDALAVDIEFHLSEDAPPDLLGLQVYWQGRNGAIKDNLRSFEMLLSNRVRSAWWEVYLATRDRSLDAVESLDEPPADADPNAKRAGRKPKKPTTSASETA